MKTHPFLLIAIAGAFTGCSGCSRPAKVSLTNASSMSVSNVQIAGEHFSQSLGTLPPGASASFMLTRPNEDQVWVTFDAAGQAFDSRGKDRPRLFDVGPRRPLSLAIETNLEVRLHASTATRK